MYLTLFKIRKMVDKGVRVEEINNNEIKFIKGTDEELCSITSESTTRISPYEIRDALRFIKEEHKQKIAEDAGKFNSLIKEEKRLKLDFGANIDFV